MLQKNIEKEERKSVVLGKGTTLARHQPRKKKKKKIVKNTKKVLTKTIKCVIIYMQDKGKR